MKRFSMIFAIVGCAAILLGAVMLGTGYAMGGTNTENVRSFGSFLTNPSSMNRDTPFTAGVEALTIDFRKAAIGTLSVQPGEQFQIEVSEKLKGYVTCTEDGGSYRIRCSYNRKNSRRNWNDQEDYWVAVTLPEGMPYREAAIYLGLGDADIHGIQADTVDLKTGTGDLTIEDISARQLYFEGGASSVTANHLKVTESLVFEAGVGDYHLQGDLRGDLSITGGVGEVQLYLDGRKEDYRISAQSGLGEVLIDDRQIGGAFSGSVFGGSPDAPNSLELLCGIGGISVNFSGGIS